MNTAQRNKTNNIKYIPTELNFYCNLNTRVKRLKKQGNISKLLIITLIIWNLFLTINIVQQQTTTKIPQFADKQNEQIMQLEEIPMEVLKAE